MVSMARRDFQITPLMQHVERYATRLATQRGMIVETSTRDCPLSKRTWRVVEIMSHHGAPVSARLFLSPTLDGAYDNALCEVMLEQQLKRDEPQTIEL